MTTALDDLNNTQNVGTGSSVTAAWFDKVRDNLETLARMPGCIVTRSTAQSIPNASPTAVQFNAADERDTDAYHDTVTNNTQMKVPAGLGGWYEVGAYLQFASGSANRVLSFRVNGSTVTDGDTWDAGTSSTGTVTALPLKLNATDYVEILTYQYSGGALNLNKARAWMRLVALA